MKLSLTTNDGVLIEQWDLEEEFGDVAHNHRIAIWMMNAIRDELVRYERREKKDADTSGV